MLSRCIEAWKESNLEEVSRPFSFALGFFCWLLFDKLGLPGSVFGSRFWEQGLWKEENSRVP